MDKPKKGLTKEDLIKKYEAGKIDLKTALDKLLNMEVVNKASETDKQKDKQEE